MVFLSNVFSLCINKSTAIKTCLLFISILNCFLVLCILIQSSNKLLKTFWPNHNNISNNSTTLTGHSKQTGHRPIKSWSNNTENIDICFTAQNHSGWKSMPFQNLLMLMFKVYIQWCLMSPKHSQLFCPVTSFVQF